MEAYAAISGAQAAQNAYSLRSLYHQRIRRGSPDEQGDVFQAQARRARSTRNAARQEDRDLARGSRRLAARTRDIKKTRRVRPAGYLVLVIKLIADVREVFLHVEPYRRDALVVPIVIPGVHATLVIIGRSELLELDRALED